ncbi:MAG: hypothetical protein ABSB18_00805 [Candidatus Omnitrophota bacterium]
MLKKVEDDFTAILGFKPLHRANKLNDFSVRKDVIFTLLAEKIFDNPRLLDLLLKKIKYWLVVEKSELTYAIAGYVYYIKEDFTQAEKYFLKALNKNRQNLDNWFDLAFSLYHQEDGKHKLAKIILFNFDYCAKKLKNATVNLKRIEKALNSRV